MNLKVLKQVKPHYLIILFVMGVLLLVFSNSKTKNPDRPSKVTDTDTYESQPDIEKRLAAIIEKINGVGNCNIFITYENNGVKKHATNTKNDETSSKDTVSTKKDVTAVMEKKSGEETPYVYEETMPQIRGVLIVVSGNIDLKTKEDITSAVSAVLGVSLHKVKILTSK